MSEDEKKVGEPTDNKPKKSKVTGATVKNFFARNWRMITAVGVSVVCTATLSVSLALALSKDKPKDNSGTEPMKGLGVFYFDTGLEEYQISLADDGKVIFTVDGKTKVGVYSVDGATLKIKFDGETEERIATLNGDVLEMSYDGGQFRFFKKVYYKVSYDEMGGTEVADATVINGQTFASPANPTKAGYEFIGWYMDSEYQTPFMFGTQIITSDITLYANWALVDFSVAAYEVDFDLGYDAVAPAKMQTVGGKLYNVPEVEREGYNFCGWWISDYENGEKLTYKYTPNTVFSANTTMFAVWEAKDLGSKLSAPQVEVADNVIRWDGVSGVSIYRLKVTGPEGFLKIEEDVSATSYEIDFDAAPAGDYDIELTAIAPNAADNSDTVKRSYINKAVGRVSQFTVLDGKVLLFNRVDKAEAYYITVDCGNDAHIHDMYYNGDSTYYNFLNCEMQEGGITFTVTATADGYASVVSETFVYNRSLDKVEGLAVDEDTQMLTWYPVQNATNYIVSVSCGNPMHAHEYVNVGNKTSFSLKECAGGQDGNIVINVYPQTKGYNSPVPTEYTYKKTKLASPSNIAFNNVDKHQVLSWTAVAGATEYAIKIGDTVISTTETSYDITEAISWITGEKYAIEVKAKNASNESAWSDPVEVHYYEMANKLSYKAGVVSWKPVVGATAYEIKVNDGAVQTVTDTFAEIELTKEGTNTIYVRFIDETVPYYSPNWITYEVNNALPVIFDSRGGSEVPMQYKVTGDKITLPQPTREGYDFVGWYNTPKGPESNGAKYDSDIFTENSELTLYAYWTPAKVVLSYVVGSDGVLDETSGEAYYTKDYRLAVPTVEDATKVFLGWFAGASPESEQLTDDRGYSLKPWALKQGATVYAHYVSNVLTFTLLEDGTYSVVKGSNATKLTSITIPETYNSKPVTVVDGNAFINCSRLVTVNIPNTVKLISEETAFSGCKRLEEINIIPVDGNKIANYSSVDGVLLHKSDITGAMELCYYPQAREGAYAIPEGVTEIPLRVFENTKVTEVTISTTVTVIRSKAFINCAQLERVVFAEGGTLDLTLEDGAFQDCRALKSITLPARLTELAVNEETHTMSIFAGCTALTHINVERGNQVYASNDGVITNKAGSELIFCPTARKGSYTVPSTIETIGAYAFASCKLLTEIVIPGNVETINEYAFADCSKVARVRFSKGAVTGMTTEIGAYAFANLVSLREIVFEDGSAVTSIGEYAFTGAEALRNLGIPSTMEYIGDYAFEQAKALSTVTFQDGNKGALEFGNYVFSECTGLTKVELPKSVTKLNLGVFDGCVNIKEIKVDKDNENYKDIDGVVFTKDGKELMFFPKGKTVENNTYYINGDIESVSEGAFRGARFVEKIVIGGKVAHIGKYAFEESSLTTLTFEEDGENTPLVIEDQAFAGCAGISSVALPARTQKIGVKAFYNVAMTEVIFPANLQEIGDYAFARTSITSVEIPANVAVFGEHVFDTCTSLETVTYAKGYVGKAIPSGTFKGTAIKEIKIPASIETIGYTAFNDCTKLTKVDFEEGTAPLVIGHTMNENASSQETSGVFMSCTALQTVNLPDRATVIGTFAFAACTALKTVNISENSNLQRFGSNAFSGCTSLSYMYIPKSVQNTPYVDDNTTQEYAIGDYAFMNTALVNVEFAKGGEGELSIGQGAFAGCGGITGYDGKGNPIIESMSVINLPARLAPIYIVWQDATGAIYSETREGISAQVFSGNTKTLLQQINIEEGGKYYGSMGGVVYKLAERNGEYVKDDLMLIPANFNGTLTIPYTVTQIGSRVSTSGQAVVQSTSAQISKIEFEATPEGEEAVPLTIGHRAFQGVTSFTSITFPDRLVAIGNSAFENTKLTAIHLPASLETLGESAFKGVNTATTITFDEDIKLTKISQYAFQNCSKITSLVIPKNVRTIDYMAFSGCSKVTSLAFAEDSQLTTVMGLAFQNMQFTSLSLPDTFTTVDGNIFGSSNSKLQTLTLPKTFTGFTTIVGGQNRFFLNGMSALKAVNIHPDNPNFMSEDGVVYTKSPTGGMGSELIYYPRAKQASYFTYTTPEGVQSIGTYAFYQNTKLQHLVISKDLMYINTYSFSGCTYLASITFEDRESPLTIGDYAFQSCYRLSGKDTQMEDGSTRKVFTISESVILGGDAVFTGAFNKSYGVNNVYVVFEGDNESTSLNRTFVNCTGIVGVENIPATLSTMNQTFNGCTGLKSATFEKDVNGMITVMSGTFKGCTALTSIDLPNVGAITNVNAPSGGWKANGGCIGAFQGCTNLQYVTIQSCISIGISAFEGCSKLVGIAEVDAEGNPTGNTYLDLPDDVVSIGIGAFYGCTSLKNINLSANLESIGDYAFQNCSNLTSVEIPTFVSEIGKSTFEGCSKISSLTLGAGIVTIGERAFYGLSLLEEVTFPDAIESIGGYAFYNCTSLTELEFPASLITIGEYAFANCYNVETITGGANITTLGDYAFANFAKVTDFTIPDALTSLGIGVFSGWNSLKNLTAGGNLDYAYKDGVLYNSSYTKIVFVSGALQGEFVIPDTITELSEALFANARITSVVIPDSITVIPARAFQGCTELVSVKMPAALETIGMMAFEGCTSLKEITIPKTVHSTFDLTFWSRDGRENGYELTNDVDGIGHYAFGNCTALENVIFEAGGTKRLSFGDFAFYNCTSLKGTLNASTGEYEFVVPSRVRGNWLYAGLYVDPVYGYGSGEMHRRLMQGIGMYAFARSGLQNIIFEDESGAIMPERLLISIGAFYECRNLKTVKFGNTLGNMTTTIAGDRGMQTFTIVAITDNAFYGCGSLTSITFPRDTSNIWATANAFGSFRVSGIELMEGVYGVDYGDGKANWERENTCFTVDGCTQGDTCTKYNPHKGIFV